MPLPVPIAPSTPDVRRSQKLRSLVADASTVVQQAEPRIRFRAGLSVYEITCALRIADTS